MVVMAVVAGEGAQPAFSGGMTTPAAHLLLTRRRTSSTAAEPEPPRPLRLQGDPLYTIRWGLA